jgi:hypothetical protein
MTIMLRFLQETLSLIYNTSLKLIEKSYNKKSFQAWWKKQFKCCKQLSVCTASSLFFTLFVEYFFTQNRDITRLFDMALLFYLGLLATDITYLLAMIGRALLKLNKYQLDLNLVDIANSSGLRNITQNSLVAAIYTCSGILVINILAVTIGKNFSQNQALYRGTLILSISSWVVAIVLAYWPQLISSQIVEKTKQQQLRNLETLINTKYQNIQRHDDFTNSESFEKLLNLQSKIAESKSFSIAGNPLLRTILALNSVPLVSKIYETIQGWYFAANSAA